MAFKTPAGSWRVHLRYNQRRVSRNFRTKALAEAFEERVKRVRRGELPPPSQETPVTFSEFADRWLNEHAGLEVAETTALSYKSVIDNHLNHAFGGLALTKLTKDHIRILRADLAKDRKPKTVNNIIQVAKQILSTAVEWHTEEKPLIAVNPWASVSNLEVNEQSFDYWTAEERDKFLASARFRDPAFAELCLVALHTGLRLGELQALTRGQLDFDRRQICVRATYSVKTKKRYDRTKTRKIGYVPMNEQVYKVLFKRVLYPPQAPIFQSGALAWPVAKVARHASAAGVKAIRFHDLRHTFASCLVTEGVDIFTVSKLLRHASVTQTMRYAHLAPDHLRQEVERISGGTDLAPNTGMATLRRRER